MMLGLLLMRGLIFNVHESNFGEQYDDEPFEWHCSAYAVELNEDETFSINTDVMNYFIQL